MNKNDFLNEMVIEMMMNALINQYKNNKEDFIKGIINSKENECILIAPAGNPLMNEEIIKMNLKFTLDKHNIMDVFKKEVSESE